MVPVPIPTILQVALIGQIIHLIPIIGNLGAKPTFLSLQPPFKPIQLLIQSRQILTPLNGQMCVQQAAIHFINKCPSSSFHSLIIVLLLFVDQIGAILEYGEIHFYFVLPDVGQTALEVEGVVVLLLVLWVGELLIFLLVVMKNMEIPYILALPLLMMMPLRYFQTLIEQPLPPLILQHLQSSLLLLFLSPLLNLLIQFLPVSVNLTNFLLLLVREGGDSDYFGFAFCVIARGRGHVTLVTDESD